MKLSLMFQASSDVAGAGTQSPPSPSPGSAAMAGAADMTPAPARASVATTPSGRRHGREGLVLNIGSSFRVDPGGARDSSQATGEASLTCGDIAKWTLLI